MATPEAPSDARSTTDSAVLNSGQKLVEYEEFIESQLRKTRGHVRGVDLAAHVLTFITAMLGYLLLVGLIDHWVVSGGLGFWGRLFFLASGLLLAGYLIGRTLPLLLKRINPLYAAQTIERSRPSLKNGLLNFLFLRDDPSGVNPVVYQAIEEQAATNLAQAHEDVAVDRTSLIRVGYVLVAVLALCAVYTLLSPKGLFRTAGRVIMPWAQIEPPTRTVISQIEPGDAQAFRGDQVTVRALVENLAAGERVTLYYTTADRQTVDRAVEMRLPPDGYKYECLVPGGDLSLQQLLEYRIEAGDAVSPVHRIQVSSAPTILVRSVEYQYPKYTGLRPQKVDNQGDLKAIEGTQVTLDAQANEPIETAHVDLNCDDQLDRRMTIEEDRARASFFLTLEGDRQTPTHRAYRLMFKNKQGQLNPQPIRHEIEVTRDQSPEIAFLAPQAATVDLPLDAALELELAGNDPDFALRTIRLKFTVAGETVRDEMLLDEVWRGQVIKKYRLVPARLGLKAGDVVDYLAVAEDNKEPQPNRAETGVRRIRIVSPTGKPPADRMAKRDGERRSTGAADDQPGGAQDPQPRGDDSNSKGDEPPSGESNAREDGKGSEPGDAVSQDQASEVGGEPGTVAEKSDSKQGDAATEVSSGSDAGEQGASGDEPAAEPSASNDGSNDGDAIDRVLKQIDEQNAEENAGKSGSDSTAGRDQANEKAEGGEKSDSSQQPGKPSKGKTPPSDASKQPKGSDKDDHQPGTDKQGSTGKSDSKGKPDPKGQQGSDQGDQPMQDGAGEGQDQSGKGQPGKAKQAADERGADEQGAGEQGAGEQGAGEKQGGKQGAGDKQPGQSGSQPAADGEPGDDDSQREDGPSKPGDHSGKGRQSADKPGDPMGDAEPTDGDPNDQPNGKGQSSGEKSGKPREAQGNQNDKATGDEQDGEAQEDGEAQGTDKGQKQPGKSKQPGAQRDDGERDDARPDDAESSDNQGQGAKAQQDPMNSKSDSPRDKQPSNSRGGDPEKHKGNSGAGQRGEESKGSPSPDQPNQPRDKQPRQSKEDQEQPQSDKAESPSNSQRESDSEGNDSGDRSGGGKQGGGQKANKSGTGGAGQNSAADEGAGRSDEAGDGEDSDRAGTDRQSDRPTGQQGTDEGPGSQTRPGSSDAQKSADSQDQNDSAGTPAPDSDASQGGRSGGKPSGSDPVGAGSNPSEDAAPKTKAGQDQADKANLEYARQATDLALRHMKDELAKDQPDPELLKRLGWSRDDMQRFVDRWEQMRAKAGNKSSGGSAQQELDDTLRSLGLRPRSTALRGQQAQGAKRQGSKESRRATPPPEFAEEYKAYTEGTARGGK